MGSSGSSNDVASGDEAQGAAISARRTPGRKEGRVPDQPPYPRPPHVAEAKSGSREANLLRSKRVPGGVWARTIYQR